MFKRSLAVRFRSLIGPRQLPLKLNNYPPARPLVTYHMLSEMECLLFDRQLLAMLDSELLGGFGHTWGFNEQHKSEGETWLE